MRPALLEIEETIGVAREYAKDGIGDAGVLAGDFAEAVVQLADACVVGLPCERHGGAVHGQEAEELRAGVEQILKNVVDVFPEDAADVFEGVRKSLIFLLDRVDARDSLAFREATDPADEAGPPPA